VFGEQSSSAFSETNSKESKHNSIKRRVVESDVLQPVDGNQLLDTA